MRGDGGLEAWETIAVARGGDSPSRRDSGVEVAPIEACLDISSDVEILPPVRDFLAITKALADPQRVRLLVALRHGELCVCQLIELLGLAGSTVSKHLAILHQAGLVASRKNERWVYYRLADKDASALARQAVSWTLRALDKDPTVEADRKRLRQILKIDPRKLCQRQMQK